MPENKLKKADAVKALKTVEDPEIRMDIYTLGLIYDIKIGDQDNIFIKMTLTSPACPFGPTIIENSKTSLKKTGFKDPKIEIVFDPPWEPSQDVKILLGVA